MERDNRKIGEIMYNYQQVYEASLEYFKGDELAASVFAGKYALQDEKGNYKESTPDDMHRRMARVQTCALPI